MKCVTRRREKFDCNFLNVFNEFCLTHQKTVTVTCVDDDAVSTAVDDELWVEIIKKITRLESWREFCAPLKRCQVSFEGRCCTLKSLKTSSSGSHYTIKLWCAAPMLVKAANEIKFQLSNAVTLFRQVLNSVCRFSVWQTFTFLGELSVRVEFTSSNCATRWKSF